eukprot:2006855-Pyramimonas_sp.AAC.1
MRGSAYRPIGVYHKIQTSAAPARANIGTLLSRVRPGGGKRDQRLKQGGSVGWALVDLARS